MVRFFFFAFCLVALLLSIDWLAKTLIYRDRYPDKLAIEVEGFEHLLVDRAELQRQWPGGLGDMGKRAQLRAHMSDIENLEAPASPADAQTTAAPPPALDLGTLLAGADIANGERRARVCVACHTFDEGGRNGVGPNLWGVVGRQIASDTNFAYSPAMSAQAGAWSFEKLDAYLAAPAAAIPGNRMAFAGIRRTKDRADVLAYMRAQGSPNAALPTPEPEPEPEPEAPAAGEDAGR